MSSQHDQARDRIVRQVCVGCKTTCGLTFDIRFNRYVCPQCLIKERDYILRKLAETIGPQKCKHKLLEYDYMKLNQTAVAANGICTICGDVAEQPT
jgi:hypothetical protein